ncbi:hypothetical protein D3C71_2102430 [compost metagenome]
MVAKVFSVTAFKTPIPSPFLVLPETFNAFTRFTAAGNSIISSFSFNEGSVDGAPPILLE